jgi:adenine phosphoribosyltransferase
MQLQSFIRDIPNFPKAGITFKDITPLLKDGAVFQASIDQLAQCVDVAQYDVIVGPESRGFIFGAALAQKLGKGFVPVRKPGKLPYTTIEVNYELEYGHDTLVMHSDAITPGQRVLIVDDLLATGGTVGAVEQLIEQAGGIVVGAVFVIELAILNGKSKLKAPTHALLTYE